MDNALAGSTVLVVDDAPDSLRFLVDTLEGEGIRVLIAQDGAAALALLERIVPDLVLMDAVMPQIDGYAATRAIKADARLAHLPVIFMTGLNETENVVRGFAAGGVDYVTKPIVIGELVARLRAHLANARMARGSQLALDTTGRPLLVVDREARPVWATPGGSALLQRYVPDWPGGDVPLPPAVAGIVRRQIASETGTTPPGRIETADGRLEIGLVGRHGPGEWLLLLTAFSDSADCRVLSDRHALTAREAEVLLWISRGKANREISDILGISPRTVNKHLEQVFEKLGVENRASAAAIAVGTLARWG